MTREQFLLLPPARISPEFQPDGRRSAESAPEMIALAYSKGLHRFDWTCVNAEGGEFIVEVSLMPIVINGQTMLHTTWRDITERTRVEETLRESESRYRRLHESMTDAFAQVDMAGTIVEVNRAFETMLGYPAKEFRQLSYRDITPERWHAEEARILAEQVIPRGYSEIYNGKYFEYFEVGRTEMMREQGLTYRIIEESGFQMPVYEAFLQFRNPAFYDELLEVETRVEKMPQAKVHIDHTIRSKDRDVLIAEGYIELAFIKSDKKKITRAPEFFTTALQKYFDER